MVHFPHDGDPEVDMRLVSRRLRINRRTCRSAEPAYVPGWTTTPGPYIAKKSEFLWKRWNKMSLHRHGPVSGESPENHHPGEWPGINRAGNFLSAETPAEMVE